MIVSNECIPEGTRNATIITGEWNLPEHVLVKQWNRRVIDYVLDGEAIDVTVTVQAGANSDVIPTSIALANHDDPFLDAPTLAAYQRIDELILTHVPPPPSVPKHLV